MGKFYRASVCGDEGLYDTDGCIISNVRSNIDLDKNWDIVVDLLNELSTNCSQLQEENSQLKQKLENNYTVKMIDGKFFINLSELIDDE